MQDRAGSRHAVEQLEMMMRVPGERADAVARPHAERDQRLGEPPGALKRLALGRPVDPSFGCAGDDLRRRVHRCRVLEQR
jgi:hypothetical protein